MKKIEPSLENAGTTGYVKGSDTSEQHAEFEKKRAGTVQSKVFEVIKNQTLMGATSQEVEDTAGLKHQSASAAIRNMELGGKVVKTTMVRNNQHAYITTGMSKLMMKDFLLPPNPRRKNYKKLYDDLLARAEEEMTVARDERTYLLILGIING